MMGTQFSEESHEDMQQEVDIRVNNTTEIPITCEIENEAPPFEGSELEATVKVTDYRGSNRNRNRDRDFCLVADILKSELIEFHNENSNDSNSNDIEAVSVLENICIPVTETKILGLGDEPTTSSDEDDDADRNVTYSENDSNHDPELIDSFAAIDCDQSFCHTTAPQNELNFSANVNHRSSSSAIRISPRMIAANTLKQNRQLKASAPSLKCQLCLQIQSSERKLQTHMELCVTSHKRRRRFCVPCNRVFCNPQAYRDHASTKHGIEEPKVYSRSFKCQFCGRSFAFEESLLVHSALHQYQYQQTSNSNKANGNGNEDEALQLKPYKCSECPSSFSTPGGLTIHMTSHKTEPKFKCALPNCGTAFEFNKHLSDHLKRDHPEIQPLKCQKPNCGKTFKTNYQLQKHMATHSIKRQLKCPHPDCHRTFRSKEGVTSHMAVHRKVARPGQMSAQSFASVVTSLQLRERARL